MATDTGRPSLTLVRQYKTTPAKVYKAWTNAEALTQWMGPGPVKCVSAESDLRVGGRYRILMKSPDGEEHDVSGTYRELVPDRRIVFTWAWKSTPDRESIVTIALRPLDTGTKMELTHEQFHDQAACDHHRQGWEGCLEKLLVFLEAN
jgi:uncharacterized protein YndB with AHSA1/START domain